MAISAAFTVNGDANQDRHITTEGATVTLAISNSSGVRTTFSIIGASNGSVTIPTLTQTGSPQGSSATFVMPGEHASFFGLGTSFLVKCVVRSNTETATAYAVVGTVGASGLLPLAYGEKGATRSDTGYIEELNRAIAAASGVGSSAGTYEVLAGTRAMLDADAGKLLAITDPVNYTYTVGQALKLGQTVDLVAAVAGSSITFVAGLDTTLVTSSGQELVLRGPGRAQLIALGYNGDTPQPFVLAHYERIVTSGVTGSRPASPVTGTHYYDTTIGRPIWYNGASWINAAGIVV